MLKKGKIAIFDDCIEDARLLRNKLKSYLGDEEIYMATCFDEEFIKNNIIDLLFLDIELEGANGIEEMKRIRKEQASKINVIFVTSHDAFVQDSIPAFPIYFIRKSNLDSDLNKAFNTLENNRFRKRKLISINTVADIEDVVYIDSHGNYVYLHFLNGIAFRERKKLDNYEQELAGDDFVRCHKSYLVNLKHVNTRIGDKFIMMDDTYINISRKYYREVVKKWQEYMIRIA